MSCGWKYAAASVIGTSHQNSSEGVCQDSHAVSYLKHASALIAIVSDGAGSASHAHIGSRLTCEFISREAQAVDPGHLFTEAFARNTIEIVRSVLFDEADKEGLEIRDFACTMLVAILSANQSSFWQVGDGAICVRRTESESYNCIYWPDKGDYANVTFFVTDIRAQQETQVCVRSEGFDEVALFTDGIERLALDFTAKEAHSKFFGGLFPHMRSLPGGYSEDLAKQIEGFLGSERVNQRTDDDKTLILASRVS
jgi:hypothetical protein